MCIRYIRIYSYIPVFVYKQKRVKIISSVRIYISEPECECESEERKERKSGLAYRLR